MSGKLDRVLGKDPETGTWHETDVIVEKRYWIGVSCSCWNHQRPWRFEVIQTKGCLYFRLADSDELFREIGHHGPIVIEIERGIRESH